MSEYQSYDFRALETPLTQRQINQLRAYSSRAIITPSGFQVSYNWGDFKGNQKQWMEKYFDAFLYWSNFGARQLELSVPASALEIKRVNAYQRSGGFELRKKDGKFIFSFCIDFEEPERFPQDEPGLDSLLALRQEIICGDLRGLYIGWLAQLREDTTDAFIDNADLEPPVPPGLNALSSAQAEWVKFLAVDPHLLAVAAQKSSPTDKTQSYAHGVRTWVASMSENEKTALLTDLALATDERPQKALQTMIRTRHLTMKATPAGRRRSVEQLLRLAQDRAESQAKRKSKARSLQTERKAKKDALLRQKHLSHLAGQERTLWKEVYRLVTTRLPKAYDEAVIILADLRDLYGVKKSAEFAFLLARIRQEHANKYTFIRRLSGLVPLKIAS